MRVRSLQSRGRGVAKQRAGWGDARCQSLPLLGGKATGVPLWSLVIPRRQRCRRTPPAAPGTRSPGARRPGCEEPALLCVAWTPGHRAAPALSGLWPALPGAARGAARSRRPEAGVGRATPQSGARQPQEDCPPGPLRSHGTLLARRSLLCVAPPLRPRSSATSGMEIAVCPAPSHA